MNKVRVFHVHDNWMGNTAADLERIRRAKSSWQSWDDGIEYVGAGLPGHVFDVHNSLGLGSRRKLPFVHDVIETASTMGAKDDDIIMLTNADTGLVRECLSSIVNSVGLNDRLGVGEYWAHRRDWNKPVRILLNQETNGRLGSWSPGIDLVAFTLNWWKSQGLAIIPNLILGCEGWDWVFRFSGIELKNDLIWHEYHAPVWVQNRGEAGELWNRMLCWEWASARMALETDFGGMLKKQWPAIFEFGKEHERSVKLFSGIENRIAITDMKNGWDIKNGSEGSDVRVASNQELA